VYSVQLEITATPVTSTEGHVLLCTRLNTFLRAAEVGDEFGDVGEDDLGAGGAEAFLGGKWADDADGADADAHGHFHIFGGVANVDTLLGLRAEPLEREAQRGGVGLFVRDVFAGDECGEVWPEIEFAELATDARAISIGDDAEGVAAREIANDAACAGQERRFVQAVGFGPKGIGCGPVFARKFCGAVEAVPVRRVVLGDLGFGEGDFERREHRHVRVQVGGVGIDEGAVPIEEDVSNLVWRRFLLHRVNIVANGGELQREMRITDERLCGAG
jgi:hypothetical protein